MRKRIGMFVVIGCIFCSCSGFEMYAISIGQSMVQELDPDGKPKLYTGDINELIKKFQNCKGKD